jgi:hypothetical protein
MKAINRDKSHLQLSEWAKLQSVLTIDDVYLPHLITLVIRCTTAQSTHLSRIVDYGVVSHRIIDLCHLQHLRIELIDDSDDANLNIIATLRHIYQFRCWIGSAAFDKHYQQVNINLHPPTTSSTQLIINDLGTF